MDSGEKRQNLQNLLKWEKVILTTMDFHCSFIDVNTVISYFLINLRHVSDTKIVYYIACYMVINNLNVLFKVEVKIMFRITSVKFQVDVAMFRKNCCRISTVTLATAATVVACLIKHPHLDLPETTREISSFHQKNVTE